MEGHLVYAMSETMILVALLIWVGVLWVFSLLAVGMLKPTWVLPKRISPTRRDVLSWWRTVFVIGAATLLAFVAAFRGASTAKSAWLAQLGEHCG